ncbi:hypothetical protein A3F38_01880 [Candidatus Saccharibacteria bacterium RIFCSPHIGHO2_12_FULL_48_21]|nr:MAG: hypothetical protein A3F38_01880 [Candidatus Saccharibacteria bacterium RIFCSPHIGHO2_12_FULL_48_21]
MKNKKKVCYVVCYKDPEYIRTRTLTAALSSMGNIELLVLRNEYRNFFRYIEMPARLIVARIKYRPDIFVVGFRAHEIFWALYPAMVGKKIIFDEFINLHNWLIDEHRKLSKNSVTIRILDSYMKWVIRRSAIILQDTQAHARLSAKIYETPRRKLAIVPVGADESTFYPRQAKKKPGRLEVIFFGNMLPLHGLEIILQSINLLRNENSLRGVHITLIGGKGNKKMIGRINNFIKLNKLSNTITYKEWVDYYNLPSYIARADLCLGGPFGNTSQARRVVSGKTYQFLAMAKPVVVGRIENEIEFRDKENCLLIEQGSPEALAKTISWANGHRAELKKIGQEARKLYIDHFSTTVLAKKLEKLLF